jgi:hypothetical protein
MTRGSARTPIGYETPCVAQETSKDLTILHANKLYYRFYTHYHTTRLGAMASIHSWLISASSTNNTTTRPTSTVDGRTSASSPPLRVLVHKHASLRRAEFLREEMLQCGLIRQIINGGIEERLLKQVVI